MLHLVTYIETQLLAFLSGESHGQTAPQQIRTVEQSTAGVSSGTGDKIQTFFQRKAHSCKGIHIQSTQTPLLQNPAGVDISDTRYPHQLVI